MQRTSLLAGISMLLLSACTSSGNTTVSLDTLLQNPFFAERYYAELTDRMTEIQIRKEKVLEEGRNAEKVETVKLDAQKKRQEASDRINEGLKGGFVTIAEYTTGRAMLLEETLWLDTTFESFPGIDLRVYLTTVVDPRDTEFPDGTSVDLGKLQSPYGTQGYAVPEGKNNPQFRTVVLYDRSLGRAYAFAQLSR